MTGTKPPYTLNHSELLTKAPTELPQSKVPKTPAVGHGFETPYFRYGAKCNVAPQLCSTVQNGSCHFLARDGHTGQWRHAISCCLKVAACFGSASCCQAGTADPQLPGTPCSAALYQTAAPSRCTTHRAHSMIPIQGLNRLTGTHQQQPAAGNALILSSTGCTAQTPGTIRGHWRLRCGWAASTCCLMLRLGPVPAALLAAAPAPAPGRVWPLPDAGLSVVLGAARSCPASLSGCLLPAGKGPTRSLLDPSMGAVGRAVLCGWGPDGLAASFSLPWAGVWGASPASHKKFERPCVLWPRS